MLIMSYISTALLKEIIYYIHRGGKIRKSLVSLPEGHKSSLLDKCHVFWKSSELVICCGPNLGLFLVPCSTGLV